MAKKNQPTPQATIHKVDVQSVINRYRAAERQYLGTLYSEEDQRHYREITDSLFSNERFVRALGYCADNESAFEMIVAVRKVVMEHRDAATRYRVAQELAKLFQGAFLETGNMLKALSSIQITHSQAGDSLYSEVITDLLEQLHLKCDEALGYWAREADKALDKGGNVSNRGFASRSREGAIHGATAEAFDRVITDAFSARKRLGRWELIADLIRLIDGRYYGGGRDISNLLARRKAHH